MDKNTFDILILTGRPASGKSEIIHFLAHLAPADRSRFHVGQLDVLDDFPMLWIWFEEDDLLSRKFNLPRLHSDEKGYFLHEDLWHVLVERLSLDYAKLVRDNPDYHAGRTALIEFSRGSEHGGYAGAFPHLSEQVLQRAAIVYVNVSFEESLRKNRRRFNPDRPDSVLEHGLPDEKMKRHYGEDDFARIAPGPDGVIEINGARASRMPSSRTRTTSPPANRSSCPPGWKKRWGGCSAFIGEGRLDIRRCIVYNPYTPRRRTYGTLPHPDPSRKIPARNPHPDRAGRESQPL